jgi:hypothetical protein
VLSPGQRVDLQPEMNLSGTSGKALTSWHHWLAGEGVGLGEAAGLGDAFGACKPVGVGEIAGLGQTFGAGNSVGLGQGVELGQGVGLGEGDVIAVGGAIWLAYDIGSLPVFLVSTFLTGGLIPSPL